MVLKATVYNLRRAIWYSRDRQPYSEVTEPNIRT